MRRTAGSGHLCEKKRRRPPPRLFSRGHHRPSCGRARQAHNALRPPSAALHRAARACSITYTSGRLSSLVKSAGRLSALYSFSMVSASSGVLIARRKPPSRWVPGRRLAPPSPRSQRAGRGRAIDLRLGLVRRHILRERHPVHGARGRRAPRGAWRAVRTNSGQTWQAGVNSSPLSGRGAPRRSSRFPGPLRNIDEAQTGRSPVCASESI